MEILHILLHDNHGKDGRSCRYIPRRHLTAVCGNHTGSGIPLRRADRHAGLKMAGHIQQPCPLLCQGSCLLPGNQYLRHDVPQLPWVVVFLHQFIELPDHPLIKVAGLRVDREHAGCIADPDHFVSRQCPCDIACQCSIVGNLLHMIHPVQYALVQMGGAPPHRHIEIEQLCKRRGRLSCIGVSPGPEGNQKLIIASERHIAMHHR